MTTDSHNIENKKTEIVLGLLPKNDDNLNVVE